jgi:hypothetical protein
MVQFAVLVPKDKDLENFLVNSSDEYDTEYLKYLIHYVVNGLSKIIERPFKEGEKIIPFAKNFISLHSKKDVLISYNIHKEHLDLLRANKINIIRRKSRTQYSKETISVLYRRNFKKGEYPFGFRLNPRFTDIEFNIHYITNHKLINKIKKSSSKMPSVVNSGSYKFLKKHFEDSKLNIDLDGAIELCKLRKNEHKNYSKYLKEIVQIIDLYNKTYKIYYKKETDGRIHTNLTRLPKVYRQFVSYNNLPLVEVDLSNSIIYFLSMLLSNKLNNALINNTPLLLMFMKSLLDVDNIEIELMQGKALNGTFYDDFIAEYQKNYIPDDIRIMFEIVNKEKFTGSDKQIRKVVKKRILAMLFAETYQFKTEQQIFETKYPNVLNVINKFKDEFGYEKLSHILLQLEAHFMINEAGRSFNNKHWRNAPLFTLHDCLITTADHVDELESIVKETFTKLIGVCPNTKTTFWD